MNPIGKYFGRGKTDNRFQVIGVVGDARYRNLREPITPTAYIPIYAVDKAGAVQPIVSGAFILRTAASDPLSVAAAVRRQVPRARSELRVTNLQTQLELNSRHTVRERLLALLALFFAGVALLLASVGLHGVLYHSVLQRRREIRALGLIG